MAKVIQGEDRAYPDLLDHQIEAARDRLRYLVAKRRDGLKVKKPRGRPPVDPRAYRVAALAFAAFERAHHHLTNDQKAYKFCRTRRRLLESLGLAIGKDPHKGPPDWDTLRHALSRGALSRWVKLAIYDGKNWRSKLITREDRNRALLIEHATRVALGLTSPNLFSGLK